MLSEQECSDLRQRGYLRLGPLLTPNEVAVMRAAFDDAWEAGDELAPETRCWVLAVEQFRTPLSSPRLMALLRTIFGDQAQLLDYHPIYQPPAEASGPVFPLRDWHRDFTFVHDQGGSPLMITIITFLDDISDELGPTVVIPGSHRVPREVVPRHDPAVHGEEVPLPARAGEGLLLNSAIVHSAGQNRSALPRRGLVMNFGYWWMKPWNMHLPLPPEFTVGLAPALEYLLGIASPSDDEYLFAPI